jgi:Rieske Fe-S protein
MTHQDGATTCGPACRTRRALLVGAGAGLAVGLAGCATYGRAAPPAQATPAAPVAPASAGGGSAGGGAVLAQAGEIPVGGGKVFADRQVVVTQPQAGTFKAFSAVCTHQGCTVADVHGGTINCPCHGSRFRIADGAVANGPAARPLPAVSVTVDEGAIRLA